MKTFFSFITALLFSILLQAQPNEVSLVVTGEGATKEEATNNALRSAIEQAFGVFVSANTEILNDEIVKDEIATISSGNVKSFVIISYSELPSGIKNIALNATVSIGHLIEYSKNHGSKAEFSGAVFGANMKLREEKKKNESKIVSAQISLLYSLRHVLFEPKITVGTPKMKRIIQVDYEKREGNNESIDTWVGDGCFFSLEHRGATYFRTEKSLIIKYPVIEGSRSFDLGTNTYTLPIHIAFISTSTGLGVLKDFLRVINSISLSAEERMDYDNESIPYYPIEWVGKKYYFRDFISTILFSEIIRVFNKCLFDDYSLSLSSIDGISDIYYLKTSPSVLKPFGMRIFGKPCDILSEYYVYSYNNQEYNSGGLRPYLHCDLESKGNSTIARFTCVEEEDDILNSPTLQLYVMRLLLQMYDADHIPREMGFNRQPLDAFIVAESHLRGLQLRYMNNYNSLGANAFNLVLLQKGKNGTVDPPIVNLFEMRMPLTYDPKYSEFASESIPKFLSGEDGSIYEYDIDLPLSTEQIQRLNGVEMISINNNNRD